MAVSESRVFLSESCMLVQSSYGKSRVRLVQVRRGPDSHELQDLTVAVRFEGDYDESYTDGDNSAVLPTDTMKNTVYALAAQQAIGDPESFGMRLAQHFLARSERLNRVRIDCTEHLWSRIATSGRQHPHAFRRSAAGSRTAVVEATRGGATVAAGIADLVILKSANSAFEGFPRDEYTTLPETRDRLLATALTAVWQYSRTDLDFSSMWSAVQDTLLDVFATHRSESVQHTLYAMGQAVLDTILQVAAIRLTMPNKHHLPIDLSLFGLENRNEIFVATEEPHGLIEATIARSPNGRVV
jgi:urate oxidase